MKQHAFGLFVLLLVAAHVASAAQRAENYELSALPVKDAIVVDGSLKEWDLSVATFACPKLQYRKEGTWPVAEGLKKHPLCAAISAAHDRNHLYLAIRVKDPTPLNNSTDPAVSPGDGWKGDCIQFRLQVPRDNGEIAWLDSWQYDGTKAPAATLTWRGPGRSGQTNALEAGVKSAYVANSAGDGYTLELALPWALIAMNPSAMTPSTTLGLGIEITDSGRGDASDPGGRITDLLACPEAPTAGFYKSPQNWGKLLLQKEKIKMTQAYNPVGEPPPPVALDDQWHVLRERIDWTQPGLESVVTPADLLAYYRGRTRVKHPLDRATRAEARNKPIPGNHLAIADDATKNILITAQGYPSHDFGEKIDWFKHHDDRQWLHQLHRHASWGSLGVAYWHTGDEKYAEAYTRQLQDWLNVCYVENMPDIPWARIQMGIRGHNWTHHFNAFIDSPAYTPELLVTFLNCCYEHGRRLTDKPFTVNNWGLMEAEGASFLGIMFPEFKDAAVWRRKGMAHLREQIDVQVWPDGHHVEQCINYHMGCVRWFSNTAELARMNGLGNEFPETFWKRLEAMVEVPMKLGFPNGETAQFGDNHTQGDYRPFLLKWADFFAREDFRYVATGGKEGKMPEQTVFALKDSGFYSMRSDWSADATCLVLNCGPHGGWHDQEHPGTFEIFAGGRRLTPDSGSYMYDGKDRDWFKQTRVHQTLTLNGGNATRDPKLLLWQPGADRDILVVENAGYKGLTHRRAVVFVAKQYFVIVDEALGQASGDVDIHFQFAPTGAVFNASALTAHTAFADGVNLLVQGMAQPDVTLVEEDGQVSFAYAAKQPRPALRFTQVKNEAPVRFVTLLMPYHGKPPEVTISPIEAPPGSRQIKIHFTVAGQPLEVSFELP